MSAPFEVPEPLEAFVDDEDAYNAWYRQHWHGYVLNADRNPKADYLVLHRVPCAHLEGRHLQWTTGQYSKICSTARKDLDDWTMSEFGVHPHRCSTCQP